MNWKRFWNDSAQVQDENASRQVGRTFRKVPYSDEDIERLSVRLLELLEPRATDTLLDLACGNGLVTSRLASSFSSVTAVDYSSALIETAQARFARANVRYLVSDVLDVQAAPHDRAVVSGAFQYLEVPEALQLLFRLKALVPTDGRVVLGDVPDGDRLWSFYRGLSGRCRYAFERLNDRPSIGRWWRPSTLHTMAARAGWTLAIHYQPDDFPNGYFRYDAVLDPVGVRR